MAWVFENCSRTSPHMPHNIGTTKDGKTIRCPGIEKSEKRDK